LTKREFHRIQQTARADSIDHSRTEHAVIIVDEDGLYKGEWRSGDAEDVRQVIAGLSGCLRWFEGQCHAGMIRILAKKKSTSLEVLQSFEHMLATMICDCPAMKEISENSRKFFDEYLQRVIGLPNGLLHTFRDLLLQLDILFSSTFHLFFTACETLQAPGLFDEEGVLKADRVKSAHAVENVVEALDRALETVRDGAERLKHLLLVKKQVLKYPSTFVTLKSDVDEMRSKIGHFDHLTVVISEKRDHWYPVGVVYADDLKKSVLGTASFRDFSSVEETKMASYVEVISIVDHHKMRLQTSTAPTLVIGDAQSSNTLVAEQSLRLNKRYGKQDSLEHVLEMMKGGEREAPVRDLVERLHKSRGEESKGEYFVDPARELCEYFSYIFGILDDTDLLSKVSRRDVVSLKSILDRMRSIVDGSSRSSVSFDNILDDENFVRNTAKALLQSDDLYSIYANVYKFREREVEEALTFAIQGAPSTFFLDTKEQNGCCRVGQAKLFCNNIKTFESNRQGLIRLWHRSSEEIFASRPHIDFFLQMISTVPSEKEVYRGEQGVWDHEDEMWIWIPEGGVPEQHCISFLNSFNGSPLLQTVSIDVEIVGPRAAEMKTIFDQNFPRAHSIDACVTPEGATIAFLRYKAGAINSRKSQVSPFLPKLLS
jgi:hypothetical protein